MPAFSVPMGATDCHHHVYDHRYPPAGSAVPNPPDASVQDYRALQERLGTTRNVIVQPSLYGFDNRLLVASLKEFGPNARGVAVIPSDIAEDELKALHAVGVRGVRINLMVDGGSTAAMMVPLARRIAHLGWHLQLVASGDHIVELRIVLGQLGVPLVFDHLGLLPLPTPLAHPAYAFIAELLATKRAWVKLSGVANLSVAGPPGYQDYSAVAAALCVANPDRLLWGTDWPHVAGNFQKPPDDILLMNMLARWIPDAHWRQRVLVENPAELYAF